MTEITVAVTPETLFWVREFVHLKESISICICDGSRLCARHFTSNCFSNYMEPLSLPDKSSAAIPPNIMSYVSILFHSGIDRDVETRCSQNAVSPRLPTSDGSVLNAAETEERDRETEMQSFCADVTGVGAPCTHTHMHTRA